MLQRKRMLLRNRSQKVGPVIKNHQRLAKALSLKRKEMQAVREILLVLFIRACRIYRMLNSQRADLQQLILRSTHRLKMMMKVKGQLLVKNKNLL